jgi:superfamily II DNA or RNA helicase
MPRTLGRITTRDYQDVAHDRVFAAWERHRSCMVVMPCRTGKTTVAASVIHTFRERTRQQVVPSWRTQNSSWEPTRPPGRSPART